MKFGTGSHLEWEPVPNKFLRDPDILFDVVFFHFAPQGAAIHPQKLSGLELIPPGLLKSPDRAAE